MLEPNLKIASHWHSPTTLCESACTPGVARHSTRQLLRPLSQTVGLFHPDFQAFFHLILLKNRLDPATRKQIGRLKEEHSGAQTGIFLAPKLYILVPKFFEFLLVPYTKLLYLRISRGTPRSEPKESHGTLRGNAYTRISSSESFLGWILL